MPKPDTHVNETMMQAVIMNWCMGQLNHIYCVPNSTVIYPWESDLISVTKAMFAHEFEIKISLADYKKDKDKTWKHYSLLNGSSYRNARPNYFWYATFGLEIEPPEHAGWINVTWVDRKNWYRIEVKKTAPKLNNEKLTDKQHIQIAKLLSWRLANYYARYVGEQIETPQLEELEHA